MGLLGGNDEVGGYIVAQLGRRELWKQGYAAGQERGG